MPSGLRNSSKTADLKARAEVFAANRAAGGVTLSVGTDGGRTRRTQVHEHGSLRVRFPNAQTNMLEAVVINTAGGMAGGDKFAIQITLEAGACFLAGTAAAEKVYRSTGPDATIALTIDAGPDSRCVWLPQETILFDRARLSRRIDVNLAEDASLIMAEAVVFGRSAMGEAVGVGRLIDRWRVRRGNRLIFAESVRLDGVIGGKLVEPAIAAGAIAVATVLVVPGNDTKLVALRALSEQFVGEVGISAWNGMALARFCAREGAALRHDVALLLASFGTPVPRLWLQ
jgi:urease accessory protein